jgi:adenylyltransferase/sulfurtransferase
MPDAGSSPTCDTAGVIMPIISSISAVQVTEALKILTGNIDSLHGSLMQIDVWQNDWRKIKLASPDPECRTCRQHVYDFLDAETPEFSAVLCGRNAVQIAPPKPVALDLKNFADRIAHTNNVKQNEYLVRFNSGDYEMTVFADARAIIRGTDDLAAARSLYARFVGV